MRNAHRNQRLALLAIGLLVFGHHARCAESEPLIVFAASSLQNAFTAIAARFEADTGARVLLNFAGSQKLAAQLAQGAPADVFASADEEKMTRLAARDLVEPGRVQIFARNRLIAIWSRKRPPPASLQDLAAPGVKLVVADPSVPVGEYTRQCLARLARTFGPDFREGFENNVVSLENNVRMVLAKVALGEADGGIVYQSDLHSTEAGRVLPIPIPEAFQITARYPIAPLRRSSQPALAHAFIDAVRSDAGRAVLARDGFLVD